MLLQKSKKFGGDIKERKRLHDEAVQARRKQLDDEMDAIIDDPKLSPKQKFSRLQRWTHRNVRQLSQHQINLSNQTLQNLDLENDITPELVDEGKASDRNPNPTTFAHGMDEDERVTGTPSKDEKAINTNAQSLQTEKSKSELPEITQAEVDIIKRKGN